MATVGIDGIYKEFGAVKALSDISFTVEDGEFAVLVGPSGCGKSTLLRMISGLDSVSGGVISIGGQEVTRVAPKDRDIAMGFQSYALYPHMTVGQNMGFGLKMRNAPEAEMVSRVAEAASILGLTEHLDRYPRQLSGGQRQRLFGFGQHQPQRVGQRQRDRRPGIDQASDHPAVFLDGTHQTGNFTPVSSSDTDHSRCWTSVSCDCRFDCTSTGWPTSSRKPDGP